MLELVGPPAGHSLSDDSDARQYNCLDMQLWRAAQCVTDVADDKTCVIGKITVMREAKRRKWR